MEKHSQDADARKERDALTVYESRLQALLDALGEKQEYTKMDLFTHTGSICVRGFLESKARVKTVRILRRYFEDISAVQYPHSTKHKRTIQGRSEHMVQEWKELQQEGKIESLKIRCYQFEPMGHFMILDEKTLYWGLYTWDAALPGVGSRLQKTYVVDGNTEAGHAMIADFQLRFNNLWELCS